MMTLQIHIFRGAAWTDRSRTLTRGDGDNVIKEPYSFPKEPCTTGKEPYFIAKELTEAVP